MLSLALIVGRLTVRMESLLFSKTVLPSSLTAWSNSFICGSLLLPILLAGQGFLLLLIPILSIFLIPELTNIFTLSSLTLVNSGTLFLCLFFHLSMTWTLSKEECQEISHVKLELHPLPLFLLLFSVQCLATSEIFFNLPYIPDYEDEIFCQV